MKRANWLAVMTLLAAWLLQPAPAAAINPGQVDNFQDGTTQNWAIGVVDPLTPVNVLTGGPGGVGDAYLRLTSIGGTSGLGRLVVINESQWTGNYVNAGVNAITMDVKNLGGTNLFLRLMLANPGNHVAPTDIAVSTIPMFLPAGSGWTKVAFPLDPGNLTAVRGAVQNALTQATELRIMHNPAPTFPPPPIVGQLGVDNITATTKSTLPIADAGFNQTIHVGHLVQLDGSGSGDPNNHTPLSFAWTITSRPPGSTAALSNPAIFNPTFTPDKPGNYVVQLVVTNSQGTVSAPADVTINTTNAPPVASAGPDQAVTTLGATITLDGSQSFDPDGDPITYQWTIISRPGGSAAALTGADTVNPTFVADRDGSYVVQLVVSDAFASSLPDTVTVGLNNIKPVAAAGANQSVEIGDTVTLDGSGSSDANGDPLTWHWSFTTIPNGSAAVIINSTAVKPNFITDLPGAYVVQLVVNDGILNSDPGTVQIQALAGKDALILRLQELSSIIGSLDKRDFKNARLQKLMIINLHSAMARVAKGQNKVAWRILRNLVIRTDGCAAQGGPDRNDWILDCNAQAQVGAGLKDLMDLLQAFF